MAFKTVPKQHPPLGLVCSHRHSPSLTNGQKIWQRDCASEGNSAIVELKPGLPSHSILCRPLAKGVLDHSKLPRVKYNSEAKNDSG